MLLELLGLGPLVEQLNRTMTGTTHVYARSKLQLQALLIPAAVYLALAAVAAGMVARARRRARLAGGLVPDDAADQPPPPGLLADANTTDPRVPHRPDQRVKP